MANRKSSALKLAALPIAALLACTVSSRSLALMTPILGKAPSFTVPDSVPEGTKVQVSSSSDNMSSIAKALQAGFESKYPNASVSVETKDAITAIQDVRSGNADLAAISTPLTAEQKTQGLVDDPVRREKIAIIVGQNNPFAQSITGSQFARMFRGEITNWKEVGGPDKPIRFIDRPATSETRQSLQPYPVFVNQPFETGKTATQVKADDLSAIASGLGDDGISYALVGQLEGQSDVKAIKLHQTLPDDPLYPFSQPYSFVYAGGASPAVAAFLGYATGAAGQTALNSADLSGYAIAPAAGTVAAAGNNANGTAGANGNAAVGTSSTAANPDGNVVIVEETETPVDGVVTDGADGDLAGRGRWWWLLLPLAGLALLIWAASKRGADEETGYIANADRDDTIRTNYRGGAGSADLEGDQYATSGVGSQTDMGINRAGAGGPALAGGAAAAGAGLAGRAASRTQDAGDITMDLDSIDGSVQGGIDNVEGSTQGGLGNLPSNSQGGVEGIKGGAQGGIDSAKGNFPDDDVSGLEDRNRGGIDSVRGSVQSGIDRDRPQLQGGVSNVPNNVKGNGEGGGSWLDRAKQRINEASEQVKDQASDNKDDVTGNDNR